MSDGTLSVLLVEDDDVVRMSMRFALESAHLHVSEAGSIAEAEASAGAEDSDVVVIDLHLPDGNGYDLAARLWRRRPRLPLVMISTDPDGIDPAQLPVEHGRSVLLAKPFSAGELLDAISLVAADLPGATA